VWSLLLFKGHRLGCIYRRGQYVLAARRLMAAATEAPT
jgi:hypothetical protein